IPGVYSIQVTPTDGGLRSEMSDQINVNNFDGTNAAFPGYENWLTSVGLDGNGVIIANVDGGVQNNHPDLINRLIGCFGSTCGGGATDAHGTHTAGIMAADGSSGTTDGFGFLRGLGVAPGANLVEQLYSPTFLQPGGMLLLMTQSYNNGASLSGNSWGPAGTPQGYDNDTLQVDIGVRDADPNAAGNQPLTFVLSFMNGNGGTSSQGTPDEAKNIFTIGSTKMQQGGGAQILDINDVSANSAHGPALDGRTIPHMVAPGCSVDSSTSGSGHTLMCGTSMASPHVSGAVALFIEYYRNLPDSPPDPSPALIKAAFLPVAKDLAGFRNADNGILGHVFDSKQGWGRMDLEAVVDPPLSVRYFDNPQILNNTGEEWNVIVSPVDPAQPMRIMLVWTDAPGHGLGGSTPAWNNDLDLVVEAGAATYLGNVFGPAGWSMTGGTSDFRNNTEGVFLGPLAPASATIRVIAADINSDGIPNSGTATDQDFAIVCYNCANEPGFTLAPRPSTRNVCAPNDAVYTIEIDQILDFSESVTLTTSGEPAGTSTSFSANPVTPPETTVLTISGTGAAAEGSYSIGIDGTAPSLSRSSTVTLNLFLAAPGTSLLTGPNDAATGVSLTPTFSWASAASAADYQLQVATDFGMTDIVVQEDGLADTSIQIETPLTTLTTYYWRVLASNVCGDGGYSDVFSFTTREIPAILLVDDDDNTPNVRSTYTSTLDAIGRDFDVWDTNNTDNEPRAADLAPYKIVIWFTGVEFGGTAGPGAPGESALATFLNAGNCLFISSQDYYFDRGLTGFMQSFLGVQAATSDVTQTSVTGDGALYGGMGPYTLSYPFTNYSDRIIPNAGATTAFVGNVGDAAVMKESGIYRTTFWGVPFESIP
ncbi:MAG: S8 family serine peptidase, partial [Planctomycetes bacterium]|nr:S8 family serine peptidase [Planctomycetota bacterium]